MSEWQDRRRFRRWFSSRWALVLFLLVAIFLTRAVWRAWWQSRTVTAERDAAKAELAELAARRAELTRELATLETERGQETLLRQKFPIAREGEGGIVLCGGVRRLQELVGRRPNRLQRPGGAEHEVVRHLIGIDEDDLHELAGLHLVPLRNRHAHDPPRDRCPHLVGAGVRRGRPRHQPPRRMVAGAPLLAIQLKSKTRV